MAKLARKPAARLLVLPNPYSALDHEGRPAGAVLLDPVDHLAYGGDDEPRRYVGAQLVAEEIKPATRYTEAVYDRGWEFSVDPVDVPATQYYLQHLRTGDLFAADVESHVTAGMPRETFRPAKDRLAEAKAAAIGRHAREYGADSVPAATRAHWAEHLESKPGAKPKATDRAGAPAPAQGSV